jgi:hypothetical protein
MFALLEFDIRYQPAKAVKGQALADLVAERTSSDIAALSIRAWAMYCDSSCTCNARYIFISVKYVFVCIKLMCVYVKLLKI